MSQPNLVIPYTVEELEPGTKACGESLGARFVNMSHDFAYWDLLEELWGGDDDFMIMEHDVLATDELIESMWACNAPWCSATYGRWWPELLCAPGHKPCGEPPNARCGESGMTEEKAARLAACPVRLARRTVLKSDSWLGLVKFGSIRRQIPDFMRRAEAHSAMHPMKSVPARHFDNLPCAVFWVLEDEAGLTPHIHFPLAIHCKEGHGMPVADYDEPWDEQKYELDLATIDSGGTTST
jgi:hypothetical protein